MEKVTFIINPVSGTNSKTEFPRLIETLMDRKRFIPEIIFTDRKGHGAELAKEALLRGAKKIIAVGGDGTINEIAGVLLHTDVALGIIPSGSGNGLARHLKIPLNIKKAIGIINKNNIITMDTGSMNGHPFFCTSGVGFDAHIGNIFAEKIKRGFSTYIKTTFAEFINYRSSHYKIAIEGKEIETDAFLITIANTSQYGNNAFISPYADVQDGLLDVCILSPFPKYLALDLARRLFGKTIHRSRFLTIIKTTEVKIKRDNPGAVHLDGEPHTMGKELTIKIFPSSLRVLTE